MKKLIITLGIVVVALSGTLFYRNTLREREIVILSTNDMHASTANFARLATAVALCRDTVATILTDAGDRWTGNAFVDLAEGRRPILDLMNTVGYDVVTLGNHEFDLGAEFLQRAIEYADFETVCANVISHRDDFVTPPSCTTITTKNGVRVCFSGVVTNYDNGHPDGDHAVFENLEFFDPMQSAREALDCCKRCDVRVLLSHMADAKDMVFADEFDGYDVIIGGHSHNVVDTLVGRTTIGQTGRKLRLVGATRIRLKGNEITSVEYENIDLAGYVEDKTVAEMVAQIHSNPELLASVGTLGVNVNRIGLADLETRLIAEATDSEIGFYHYGGIRLTELAAGGVSLATLFDLEPFFSNIYTMRMTPAQLRTMIIAKFNDTANTKESHRVDLFCSTPYDIIVDAQGEAVDVCFPLLKEGRVYKIAMADYIAKKYPSIEATDIAPLQIKVLDVLAKHFREHSPVTADNTPKQRIIRK